MRDTVIIGVTALLCLTIVIVIGLVMGHDGALLAGGIASITGIAGGFGAYKASAAKFAEWHYNETLREMKEHERNVSRS